jgi:hypothetical protein
MTPIRSPSETVNEMFRNKGATPYFFDNPCALSIGGNVSLFFLVAAVARRAALASTLSSSAFFVNFVVNAFSRAPSPP